MTIRNLRLQLVHDSRGELTPQITISTPAGDFVATAPCGKSRGRWEARTRSTEEISKIFPTVRKSIIGKPETEADKLLEKMGIDKIGANLSIAISIAATRAVGNGDAWKGIGEIISVPYPLGNVIGGGAHGGGLSIQEVLVAPVKARNIKEAVETNWAIWKAVGSELNAHGTAGRNDEGAWTSAIDEFEALGIVREAARKHGARVGIDLAASQLYKNGKYRWPSLGRELDTREQLDMVIDLIGQFNLFYVEDPFVDTDWNSFSILNAKTTMLVCSDDLFATNPSRLIEGIKKEAASAMIVKPDQVGTVSKALETITLAIEAGLVPVVSHRSGETADHFIADFAAAVGAPFMKCGISGEERVAKVDRLIELSTRFPKIRMAKVKL
jgi:enolase